MPWGGPYLCSPDKEMAPAGEKRIDAEDGKAALGYAGLLRGTQLVSPFYEFSCFGDYMCLRFSREMYVCGI